MKKILPSKTELRNGDFRIEKHLGGGGFGITYLATWIQKVPTKFGFKKSGEKTVVIKEFFYEDFCRRADDSNLIQITDGQKRHEFERLRNKLVSEGDILNSFKHPHIVEVHDVFEENNTAYVVMEYVAGEDLEKRIERNKRCSPDEAIRYISQIASALIEVHKKRVLHLDISPSNILINKNDEAQLIDFGVSLVYDPNTGNVKESSRLLAGKKAGFSPPEQTLDTLRHFSPPIDLYALGATLYNALTGHKPPESALISTGAESLAYPSSYNPKISDYLDHFVLKAMNIKINERFQKAEEFIDALLNGESRYISAMRKGNEYYTTGNYQDALTHFEAAYQLINTNDDLNTKINRCKLKIVEQADQEKEKERFQTLLTQTAVLFDQKEYKQAVSGYKQLLTIRPGDSFYIEQIRKCEERIKENLYNQAISEGDTLFEKKNYEVAILSYKQALQYKKDDSDALSKITACKENLDSTKILTIKQPESESQKKSSQTSSNKRLRLVLFSIIGFVAVVLIGFAINFLSNSNTEQKAEKLIKLRIDANQAFEEKKWNKAYNLYRDIKKLDPDDETGYNSFLYIGTCLMGSVGACDGNVKDLLTKAKNLKNTSEVNDLLKKCN